MILDVDLTNAKIKKKPLDDILLKTYLGGRGLNSMTLYDELKPGVDALSPENILLIAPGLLNGTLGPATGRFTVTAKSPLTDIFGDANCGGYFGPELKYAGYNQIIIRGCSKKPVYLWINDDEVVLRDASHLWGKDTYETKEIICEELDNPKAEVITIGQAGENLVRFACIINPEKHAAGRCGMGAVMGSKRLKAIAVYGTKGVTVAKPEEFMDAVENILQKIYSHDSYLYNAWYGTPLIMDGHAPGACPRSSNKNFNRLYFDHALKLGGQALIESGYVVKSETCFSCPVHCHHYLNVKDGPYAGTRGTGLEYQTLASLGERNDLSELDALIKMNDIVNRYGMDPISAGGIISWAIDCFQRGLITKEDTDGLVLRWGDSEIVIQLLELIARRKGIGNILAEGEKRAPKILGRGEELMPHAKGMTFADGDPRGAYLQALGYATSTRGGDHLRKGNVTDGFSTEFDLAEQLFGTRKAIDPLSPEGKGRAVHWGENVGAVDDSIGLCKFLTKFSQLPALTLEDIAPLVSSATGFNFSASTLFNIGERIYTIEKAFNIREGLERKDDYLPKRFLEPHPDGLPGVPLDKMLDDYYESRGWDKKTGLIPRKKFEELGLREIADELEALGKLPKG